MKMKCGDSHRKVLSIVHTHPVAVFVVLVVLIIVDDVALTHVRN